MWSMLLAAAALLPIDVKPLLETVPEKVQTDDPAFWLNRANPKESLIFGTIKSAVPDGAIVVYKLDGSALMRVPGVDRPNNIDVGYGLRLGKRVVDIAVATERNKRQLRVFEIVPGSGLKDLAALPVFAGEGGESGLPMGIALYRRPSDKAMFAIVSRKTGRSGAYLWQYLLSDDGTGKLQARKVREFGTFSGSKEIESVAVDQQRGHVYYSDEGAGLRKYHADPAHSDAARELAFFGQQGWKGDREGIAIHGRYIVATDQQPANSEFHVFSRDTLQEVGIFRVGADTTDGIEISPTGIFIAMNDRNRNFILADFRAVLAKLRLKR